MNIFSRGKCPGFFILLTNKKSLDIIKAVVGL
nr:MAG TPA: hypothetical protein [Caudoviricetes sp.]